MHSVGLLLYVVSWKGFLYLNVKNPYLKSYNQSLTTLSRAKNPFLLGIYFKVINGDIFGLKDKCESDNEHQINKWSECLCKKGKIIIIINDMCELMLKGMELFSSRRWRLYRPKCLSKKPKNYAARGWDYSTHVCLLLFTSSVTRIGDLLDFGQVFKAFGNN